MKVRYNLKVMIILLLVRNFTPADEGIMAGGWNIAEVARNTFDLEDKVVGTLGAGTYRLSGSTTTQAF